MLAIARALLGNPQLLIMDEPTEGLAPVIVEQVEAHAGASSPTRARWRSSWSSRISAWRPRVVRPRRHHGQRPHQPGHGGARARRRSRIAAAPARRRPAGRRRRSAAAGTGGGRKRRSADGRGLSRRTRRRCGAVAARPAEAPAADPLRCRSAGRCRRPACGNRWSTASRPEDDRRRMFAIPFAERIGRTAIVAGTFDTKGRELNFIRDRLKALGIPTRTVDLSTSGKPSTADVTPLQVASMHPGGTSAVFSDRSRALGHRHGRSVRALDRARAAYRRHHLRRRLGRHDLGDRRHARAAGRHSEGDGLHGRRRRRARLCRRHRHRDVPFGRRRAGPQFDHRAGARPTPRMRSPA